MHASTPSVRAPNARILVLTNFLGRSGFIAQLREVHRRPGDTLIPRSLIIRQFTSTRRERQRGRQATMVFCMRNSMLG